MTNVVLVQTAPRLLAGSMPAYADLVRQAVASTCDRTIALESVEFHDPNPGASMWRHHLWRLRHGRAVFQRAGCLFHVLDGSMAGFVPARLRPRTLVTVHDVIPALQRAGSLPGRPSLPAAMVIRAGLNAIRSSAGICAVSHQTARDVARFTGRTDAVVIPHALRGLESSQSDTDVVLPAQFLLHVGNNASYKNREGVLEVFARLQDISSLHLVMAGPPPGESLKTKAGALDRVIFLEDVSDALLARLYKSASALLFPSLYEGFGMPVMEAMSSGCPVVCSDDGALVETAGDATLVAPARNVDGLAAHCRRILRDSELREHMVQAGRKRASAYTLERMGAALVAWYQNCLASAKLV